MIRICVVTCAPLASKIYFLPHCRVYKESVRTMDNRRVMKAYRNRAKENVLPYPSRSGLFSRVKRYFSGSSIPNDQQHEQTRRPTEMADAASNRSAFILPESSTPANNTFLEADQSTNRVLSSFFQEKGDRPLSQIEYEGVMSLLEKSKASITLPIPESTPEKKKAPEEDASNVSAAQHNHTFAPFSQNMLRNTSMYEGNTTSFVTPDYKPIYHTFADTSRGNISVKRVYQFSGLPSPYRTRIKAPNMAARRARRLESLNAVAPDVSSTPSAPATESTTTRVMSNTANSLLSILDGNATPETEKSEVSRPLHNPYMKYKRKFTPVDARELKRAALGAEDITKTMSFNKAEEVPEVAEEIKKTSVSVDATNSEAADEIASTPSETKSRSQAAPQDAKSSEDKSKPIFQFAQNTSTTSTFPGESVQTLEDVESIRNDVPSFKPEKASFERKEKTKTSDIPESTPAFSFGSHKPVETTTPVSNGFTFGAKTNSTTEDKIEKTAPKQDEQKKTFSFGLPPQTSRAPDSLPKPNQTVPSFSFGAKPTSLDTLETKTPGGFSSGNAQVSAKLVVSGSNGSAIGNNGNHFDFQFPPVEMINARVDENKVELYKLMFEF